MASYFYLMSSLPMLKADGEMPITYEHFLSCCSGNVSEAKYNILKSLSVNSDDIPVLKEWSEFYKDFKKELSSQRNRKLGRQSNTNDTGSEASKAIAMAIAEKNPLSAEKILLSVQFEKLDMIIGTHSFDDYALFGYALKLKLLERQTVFDFKDGKKELNRLVKNLESQISNIG